MAQDPDDTKADVYAARERDLMVLTQQVRERLFGPMLRVLSALGVTPDHLTLLSLAAGVSFCGLYFWSKPVAFAMIALHIFLDGLDGPLARFKGTASRSGSFTDTMADQMVITATTITLMYAKVIDMVPGTLYIVIYTVVVLFAMARNMLDVPYAWIIRPRFYVYGWFLVETYFWPGTINYFIWACVGVLALKLLTGFLRIRRRI
jgi:phosphatidylglycerophosphate synthase